MIQLWEEREDCGKGAHTHWPLQLTGPEQAEMASVAGKPCPALPLPCLPAWKPGRQGAVVSCGPAVTCVVQLAAAPPGGPPHIQYVLHKRESDMLKGCRF